MGLSTRAKITFQGPHLWRKLSALSGNHWQFVAPPTGVGHGALSFPHQNVDRFGPGQIFYTIAQFLRVPGCNIAGTSRRQCWWEPSRPSVLSLSVPSSLLSPEPWGKGMWYRCPFRMSALRSLIVLILTSCTVGTSIKKKLSNEQRANQPSTWVSSIQASKDRDCHSVIRIYFCLASVWKPFCTDKSPASLTRCVKSLWDCSVFSLTLLLWRRVRWHLDQKIRDLKTRNQASGNRRGHRTTYRNLGKSFNGYEFIDHNVRGGAGVWFIKSHFKNSIQCMFAFF